MLMKNNIFIYVKNTGLLLICAAVVVGCPSELAQSRLEYQIHHLLISPTILIQGVNTAGCPVTWLDTALRFTW